MSFQSYRVITALRSSSLPATQRHVLIALAWRADACGECWAAQTTIAADTGLDARTVRRALAALVGVGCLVARPSPGSTTTYRVVTEAIPLRTPAQGTTPRTEDLGSGGAAPRTQDPDTPDRRSGADGRTPDTGSGGPRTQDPDTPDRVSDDPSRHPSIGSTPTPQPPAQGAGGSPPAGLVEDCHDLLVELQAGPQLLRLVRARDDETARRVRTELRRRRRLPAGTRSRTVADALWLAAQRAIPVGQPHPELPLEQNRDPPPVDPAAARAWAEARPRLEHELTRSELECWVDDLVPVRLAAGALRLHCPSDLHRSFVDEHFLEQIATAVAPLRVELDAPCEVA